MAYSTPVSTKTGLPVCHSMETALIESSSYMNISKYEVRDKGRAEEGSSEGFTDKWKDPECSSSPGSKWWSEHHAKSAELPNSKQTVNN